MIEPETTLVERAQRGDHAAFEELVRRCSRLVFARLYLETGDTHQAEDLLQDTLLVAFRTIGQLAHVERFRSWLLRIAQNIAIDAGRRRTVQRRALEREANKVRLSGESARGRTRKSNRKRCGKGALVILRRCRRISLAAHAALSRGRGLRDHSNANRPIERGPAASCIAACSMSK